MMQQKTTLIMSINAHNLHNPASNFHYALAETYLS